MAHRRHNPNENTTEPDEQTCSNTALESPEHSLIQLWERAEDIQLNQPPVDLIDNWSSDGDSASSSSTDGGSETESRGKVSLLKRARIFTTQEAIDQAIDRWQAYIKTCSRALDVLRQQLVETYVPYALEKHKLAQVVKDEGGSSRVSSSTSTVRRRRALRNMLRHSIKVANQRHLTCMSKFASVSSHLAPWRKSGVTQRCRFRDPTTTTWEKPCSNLAVPLLPVCAMHLVQLNPTPASLPSRESVVDRTQPPWVTSRQGSRTAAIDTRESGGSTLTSTTTPTTSTLHLPPQFLFRRCGGGPPDKPCTEAVIAWSPQFRCPQHTTGIAVASQPEPESHPGSLTEKLIQALQPIPKTDQ